MKPRPPSTTIWLVVHVVTPLLPFLLGGTIRLFIRSLTFSWATYSAADLAISLALVAVFVNQSLLNSEPLLDNPDKREDLRGWATVYFHAATGLIALFAVIIALVSVRQDMDVDQLDTPIRLLSAAVFVTAPVLIGVAAATQRSFKLKATV